MRGGSPSQTLPFAGGQPPTPPGSVSPLHHDQRPALDPLIHRAGIHKTSSQTSPPRPKPGPTRLPVTASCISPHAPGQICRRELQAQNDVPRRYKITRLSSMLANPGRPCASPSPSLRSTSASAWAAGPPRRRSACKAVTREHRPHGPHPEPQRRVQEPRME